MNPMRAGFCRFPQNRFWHDVRDHLQKLPNVGIKDCVDDPVVGSWIDFTYGRHVFTVNAKSGEYVFFVDGDGCPDSVLGQMASHFQPFFDGDGETSLRRV
jgi:hypothetical protein